MVHIPRKPCIWVVLIFTPHIGGLCNIFIQSNKHKVSPDYENYPQKFTGYPQHNRITMFKRETPQKKRIKSDGNHPGCMDSSWRVWENLFNSLGELIPGDWCFF